MKHDIKLWCLSIHWDGDYAQGDVLICTTKEACIKAFHDTLFDLEQDGRVMGKKETEEWAKKNGFQDAEFTVTTDDNGYPKFEYSDGDYTTAHMSMKEISLMEDNLISVI